MMHLPTLKVIAALIQAMAILYHSASAQDITVRMEPYLPAAGEDAAQWMSVSYIDGHLTRQEILNTSSASDAYFDFRKRASHDNGRTWSDFIPLQRVTRQLPGGGLVTYPGKYTYDSNLKILYQTGMRRLFPGRELYDYQGHAYIDHSMILENGRETEMIYETGPSFDPENPFDSLYQITNRAYMGQQVVVDKDGKAFFPLVCYRSGPGNLVNQGGVVLMSRDPVSGQWSSSNQQYISPNLSSRGLLEPDVAILNNGHLLIVCRGSNVKGQEHTSHPDSLQSRKWFLLSSDGGKTLSPVSELRYDDGSRFYSPSSIHSFIRSSENGKLYWVANITETEPVGNSPRYPLYIAEIDESIPAVKKSSLVMIDDRRENETERLQLSNFSLIENRENRDIEIYITKIGSVPDHFWQGAVYKYILSVSAD